MSEKSLPISGVTLFVGVADNPLSAGRSGCRAKSNRRRVMVWRMATVILANRTARIAS
jgi:hypothetical protein